MQVLGENDSLHICWSPCFVAPRFNAHRVELIRNLLIGEAVFQAFFGSMGLPSRSHREDEVITAENEVQ